MRLFLFKLMWLPVNFALCLAGLVMLHFVFLFDKTCCGIKMERKDFE